VACLFLRSRILVSVQDSWVSFQLDPFFSYARPVSVLFEFSIAHSSFLCCFLPTVDLLLPARLISSAHSVPTGGPWILWFSASQLVRPAQIFVLLVFSPAGCRCKIRLASWSALPVSIPALSLVGFLMATGSES
jgi:hypothetical protein